MKKSIKATVAIAVLVCFYILAGLFRMPVHELEAEIEMVPEWSDSNSTNVYMAGGTYFVEMDMEVTEDNYEESILNLSYIIGCTARSLPESNGDLCVRTTKIDFTIGLGDCRTLHGMVLDGESETVLLNYLDSVVVFSDR